MDIEGIIYRVVIKMGYRKVYFDFTDGEKACEFACSALTHSVPNEDEDKMPYICVKVIDSTKVESEDDD